MISIDEIRSMAAKVKLSNIVVEKDYALGWLLWGIHKHPDTKKNWVFKGGTCIKKCYIETHRFSEDLDFTYQGDQSLTLKSLEKILQEIADFIFEESGLEFQKSSIQFEIFKNPRGTESIQGGIKYRGPVRPQVGLAQMQRIKIDITTDEKIVLKPLIKQVKHPYSDSPGRSIRILSYCYEEIFAEKLRALVQRLRPRDLYDVIHIYRHKKNISKKLLYATLELKCQARAVPLPTIKEIESHKNMQFLKAEWENQLKHQIAHLEPFQYFLDELPKVFAWLYNT